MPEGGTWAQVAVVGANSQFYPNTGLQPSSTYSYRVRAFNVVGNSVFSNVAFDTTEDPPPYVDDVAQSETPVAGSVAGSYTYTWSSNGVPETITERHSGGKPANRHSYLEHEWRFYVRGGKTVTLFLDAWANDSGEGDSFAFSYSTDGSNFTDMFVFSAANNSVDYATFALPNDTLGAVDVRVVDTDRTTGNSLKDSISIDHIFIRSEIVAGTPPLTPTLLTATGVSANQIDLTWSHESGTEYGFEIDRSEDGLPWVLAGTTGAGVSSYYDTGLSPNTIYSYRLRAFNGSGPSGDSNVLWDTTLDGSDITLTAAGHKIKGVQHAHLEWSGGSSSAVDIYRDGALIKEKILSDPATTNSYHDDIKKKGGGSYRYQVCAATSKPGSAGECSNLATIVF